MTSWHELRTVFKTANAKKAIAATQYNHASTRGHCILVFEAEMPHPSKPGVKRTGRLYVCDLAGAEPAASVHHSIYKRVEDLETGHVRYVYSKPGSQKKTDELVKQGKKINLSLSEMTGFFRQMAKLIKRGKFNPGRPIPGCRTYFLGKFLKNTLMHAQTYLFAAVRPELKYQTFTEATLNFATNASVVKLRPRRMDSHGPTDLLLGAAARDHEEHGLFADETKPQAMMDKLAVVQDMFVGRRPLALPEQTRVNELIARAGDVLPSEVRLTLIQLAESSHMSGASVLYALRKALSVALGQGGAERDYDQNGEADGLEYGDLSVSANGKALARDLDGEAKRISDVLKQDQLGLDERAARIAELEKLAKEDHTRHEEGHHSDNDTDTLRLVSAANKPKKKRRARRGSVALGSGAAVAAEAQNERSSASMLGGGSSGKHTLKRRGSTLSAADANRLFDEDHQRVACAHAIMLASGKRALNAVLALSRLPPAHDDDEQFLEAALRSKGTSHLSLALALFDDILRLANNGGISKKAEAEALAAASAAEAAKEAAEAAAEELSKSLGVQMAAVQEQLEGANGRTDYVERQLVSAHEALKTKEAELAAARAREVEVSTEHQRIQADLAEKETELQAAQQNAALLEGSLTSTVVHMTKETEKHNTALATLQAMIDGLEAQLQREKDHASRDKEAAVREKQAGDSALARAQAATDAVTAMLGTAHEELSAAQETGRKAEAEASATERRKRELSAELERATAQTKSTERERNDALADAEMARQSEKAMRARAEEAATRQAAETARLREEVRELRRGKVAMEAAAADGAHALETAIFDLQAARDQNAFLVEQLSQAQSDASAAAAVARDAAREAASELNASATEAAGLRAQLAESEATALRTQRSLAHLGEEKAAADAQMEVLLAQVIQLDAEVKARTEALATARNTARETQRTLREEMTELRVALEGSEAAQAAEALETETLRDLITVAAVETEALKQTAAVARTQSSAHKEESTLARREAVEARQAQHAAEELAAANAAAIMTLQEDVEGYKVREGESTRVWGETQAALTLERNDAQSKVQALAAAHAAAMSRLEDLQGQAEHWESDRKAAESALAAMTSEVTALSTQGDDLAARLEEAETAMQACMKELHAGRGLLADAESRGNKLTATNKLLESALADTLEQMANLGEAAEVDRREQKQLAEKCAHLEAAGAHAERMAETRAVDLRARLKAAESRAVEAEQEHSKRLDHAARQLREEREARDNGDILLAEIQMSAARDAQSAQDAQAAVEAAAAAARQQAEAAVGRLAEANASVVRLERELAAAISREAALRGECEAKATACNDLRDAARKQAADIAENQRQLADMHEALKQATEEVAEARRASESFARQASMAETVRVLDCFLC